MKLFSFEVERSYWLAVVGVVAGIYLWFFLTVVIKFVDLKNEKTEKANLEDLQSLKEQVAAAQRFKYDDAVSPETVPAPELPAGFNQTYTTHFTIYSFDEQALNDVPQSAEKIYNTIIADTNLYNFNPPERFSIYIYKDVEQYEKLTKRPEWSGGFVSDRKIYTFSGKHLDYILPHEISHLIFNDFMGDRAAKVSKWINEGLAMYEENKNTLLARPQFDKNQRMPLTDFLTIDLSSEKAEKVNIWYRQAESLVTFLLEKRAREKFYNFLIKLRETENIDESLFWGYQSEFKDMTNLEKEWLKE